MTSIYLIAIIAVAKVASVATTVAGNIVYGK